MSRLVPPRGPMGVSAARSRPVHRPESLSATKSPDYADDHGRSPRLGALPEDLRFVGTSQLGSGGDGGIRTLDALLAHTPLAGEHLRPLGHVSGLSHRRPGRCRHRSPGRGRDAAAGRSIPATCPGSLNRQRRLYLVRCAAPKAHLGSGSTRAVPAPRAGRRGASRISWARPTAGSGPRSPRSTRSSPPSRRSRPAAAAGAPWLLAR